MHVQNYKKETKVTSSKSFCEFTMTFEHIHSINQVLLVLT